MCTLHCIASADVQLFEPYKHGAISVTTALTLTILMVLDNAKADHISKDTTIPDVFYTLFAAES